MKKIVFFVLLLFLGSFYFVYQQSKIYILAYEISAYQRRIAALQSEEEAIYYKVLPYMRFAAVDDKLKDLHLSFYACSYVKVNADMPHPAKGESLLARIFSFNSRAEAKP